MENKKVNLCLRIDEKLLNNIKQQSREKSSLEKKDISSADLIREILKKKFGNVNK